MGRSYRFLHNTEFGMKLFFRRHLPEGHFVPVPCTMALLGPNDTEAGVALHNNIAHGLSKDIFMPSSEEDIRRFFCGGGLAIGVYHGSCLVCLRTLITDKAWAEESFANYGYSPPPGDKTAITGFCIVDKEFRGNNIQFLTYYHLENIIAGNFDSILTTVSPKNIFSLQNVIACGYNITGLINIRGGFLRFILKKEFRPGQAILTNRHKAVPIRDLAGHHAAIDTGAAGYKIIRRNGGFHILYGHRENKLIQ